MTVVLVALVVASVLVAGLLLRRVQPWLMALWGPAGSLGLLVLFYNLNQLSGDTLAATDAAAVADQAATQERAVIGGLAATGALLYFGSLVFRRDFRTGDVRTGLVPDGLPA